MTRRTFAATLAAGACLRAQTSQEKGRKIIDQTIDALGGDGFRYMQTRVERGRAYSFYLEQISGLEIATIYTKYTTTGEVQRQAFGKKQDDWILLTDTLAYEISYRGARPLGDDRLKQFHESTLHDVFYILRMRLNEPGMAFEARGIDVVENQPVHVVDIYDSENRNVTVWINSDTFLPVRQRFLRWDPIVNLRREEVARFTKYRQAGNGVVWPHETQRDRDGEKTFVLYSERVSVGDELKDGMFEMPAGVKILNKK
jgi:hypothetical protein